MNTDYISTDDLFGRFYLGMFPSEQRVQRIGKTRTEHIHNMYFYFGAIKKITSFVIDEKWKSLVTGFYINTDATMGAVRLSYFTQVPHKLVKYNEKVFANKGLNLLRTEGPEQIRISDEYGREELRFRRFLSTYTSIALELMEVDLQEARRHIATFRWKITRPHWGCLSHFVPFFQRCSAFFNDLSAKKRSQFIEDLDHLDWAHFLVNMILPEDWLPIHQELFSTPHPPLTNQEISILTRGMDLEIPDNWSPEKFSY